MERTRDVIQIEHGGDEGIIAVVTAEALELRLPTIEWTMGAYGPARSSRLWRRIEWRDLQEEDLSKQLAAARRARRREFRKCKYCGERFSPEHRTGDACHGCTSRHEGVLY